MNVIEKLRSLVSEIREARNPMQLLDQWILAGRLLARMPVDQAEAARAVRDRDLETLDRLVTQLETPDEKPQASQSQVSDDEMDRALKAFKKRLKLARLADESKLGGRYTSGGRKSQIDAIIPPTEFGPEVWQALVRAGKLKNTGQGFYAEA